MTHQPQISLCEVYSTEWKLFSLTAIYDLNKTKNKRIMEVRMVRVEKTKLLLFNKFWKWSLIDFHLFFFFFFCLSIHPGNSRDFIFAVKEKPSTGLAETLKNWHSCGNTIVGATLGGLHSTVFYNAVFRLKNVYADLVPVRKPLPVSAGSALCSPVQCRKILPNLVWRAGWTATYFKQLGRHFP